MQKIINTTKIGLAFILVLCIGVADFAHAGNYYPQISRFDFALSLYEGVCQHNKVNTENEILAFCWDNSRSYGIDITSRVSIDKFGGSDLLSHHFYLALDAYSLGNFLQIENSKIGISRTGFDVNAGFFLPITAARGYNPFLASHYSKPVIVSAFFELGLGYMLGFNDYYSGKDVNRIKFHVLNPSVALGLNMSFKDLPELEWELGYKLMAGWRHAAYTKLQYDFLQLNKKSSLGASILIDGLWGSTSLGLGFKF